MRTSINAIDKNGLIINGYDYINQAWVLKSVYIRCGHPDEMDCGCYGRAHEGEKCNVRGDREGEPYAGIQRQNDHQHQ